MAALRNCLIAGLLLVGCVQPHTQVADRFRAEYGCEPKVRWLAGKSYRASGCGHDATYLCVNGDFETTCMLEREENTAPAPGVAQRQAWAQAAAAHVDRHYDQANKTVVVQGDFTPNAGINLQLLGAPLLQPGDIAVHLVVPRRVSATPCESMELVVNAAPTSPATITALAEGPRVCLIAHFDFAQFKPLAQRFPAFAVRRCNYEVRLSDADVQQLRKFCVIYSDMATEAATQAPRPAGAPPLESPSDGVLSL